MKRNPGATSALLQKATSQLKGERVTKPESDLEAYINSITKKTNKQKKSVNFEEAGGISISSDIEDDTLDSTPRPASPAANKFLKKKAQQTPTPEPANKFIKKPQTSSVSPSPAVSTQGRYGGALGQRSAGLSGQQSTALSKASALTSKVAQRTVNMRNVLTVDSDSDDSFSTARLGRQVMDTPRSSSQSSDSVKIGRDKGKFMKKGSTPQPTVETPQPAKDAYNKKPVEKQPLTTQQKGGPYQLRSSLKYSTNVVLSSEEESLAEFIGGLKSSESGERPARVQFKTQEPKTVGMRSPSPPGARTSSRGPSHGQRTTSPDAKPPTARRTPSPRTPGRSASPSPSPKLRRRSPSPGVSRSWSDDSNIADSLQSEVADDVHAAGGVNVIMDIEALAPAFDEMERESKKEEHRSRSPFKSSHTEDRRKSDRQSSPFKSSFDKKDDSPFKPSKKTESSPFKSSGKKTDSPFKSSEKREASPFKKTDMVEDSPFKSSGNKKKKSEVSPFRASAPSSPFKKTERDDSPFKASRSVDSSPFRKTEKEEISRKRGSSPFKAPDTDDSEIQTLSTKGKSKDSRSRKSRKKTKSKGSKSPKQDDIFSALGIQTVEDLLGPPVRVVDDEDLSEDKSEISEEIRTERPGILRTDKSERTTVFGGSLQQRFADSVSEIITERTRRASSGSYSEDFESISEKIGEKTVSISERIGEKSVSEIRTRYSGDETGGEYTTEFDSMSESEKDDKDSVAAESYASSDSDRTVTDSYTQSDLSQTRSYTYTDSRSLVPVKKSTERRSTEVQTELGLHYSWDSMGSGYALPAKPAGLGFVDPTPIAAHLVSADALEALTSYSPGILALHDMLKQQLELTQEFLQAQKHMHQAFNETVECSYRYTTLQDTKQYIKKHRKKRLTFKEALKLVDAEMGS